MRFKKMTLITLSVLAAALYAEPDGQPPEPAPTRKLAVCYLFAPEIPDLYFRDAEENPQRLRIERERFTTWNEIPVGQELPLFRKGMDAEGNETYETVSIWNLPEGDEPVRRLYYIRADRSLGSFDFTDPPGTHRPLSIRALNLTDKPVVLTLDEETETLEAYEEKIFEAPTQTNVRFRFQYGARDSSGRVRVSPVSNLRFRSERQRMTLIFGLQPEYQARGETREFLGFSVSAIRIYDVLGVNPEDR